MLKGKGTPYLVSCILLLLFFFISYKVERHETVLLLVSYSLLFGLYTWVILKNAKDHLVFWIASSIIFRFVILFSVPNLSDDFYRFIWDGRLLSSGYHPFANPPNYYVENNIAVTGINESLYSNLNSKDYFTIYPPLAQFLFWLCAELSSSIYTNLVLLKLFNFLAEIVSIIMLGKLLKHFDLATENVLIYALNPLIILELTGNAHFEAVMICFLLVGIYFITKQRLIPAATFLALSIGVKLIPIIFLPAILPLVGRNKAIKFYMVTFVVCVLLFLPLLDMELLTGFQNSLGYYFSRFEFNASIYYLVRGLGYLIFGYNIIHIAGAVLGIMAAALILQFSLKGLPRIFLDSTPSVSAKASVPELAEWNFIHTLIGSLLIYLLFTTTVHPWYVSTLLALTALVDYRFVLVWTYMIFLTYWGYTPETYNENLWIVSVEYIAVLGYFAYELWRKNSHYLRY
jgi:alpha-1,6-mannosyltransferase